MKYNYIVTAYVASNDTYAVKLATDAANAQQVATEFREHYRVEPEVEHVPEA